MAGAAVVLGLLAAAATVPLWLPSWIEGRHNPAPPPLRVAPVDRARHAGLFVADLHADSLLWGRDLRRRTRRGHLDLPRMRAGNLALAVFSIVTQVPRGLNLHRNDGRSDDITWLSMAQGLPPRTWFSLAARAEYHAARLARWAADPAARLVLLRSRQDLEALLRRRAVDRRWVGALLALEGAHAFEGRLENVARLDRAGVRMVGLVHFFDNRVGGSAHGVGKGGLTAFGRRLLRELEARRMVVDLAHASPRLLDEVVARARRPVVVSHTGVQATCPGPRNLSDAQLRAVAATGGLVGIGLWPEAVCGRGLDAVVRALRHAVAVAGVDHVALGSDFDGSVAVPVDAAGLAALSAALHAGGFGRAEVRRILGGNVLRLLREGLP